MAERNKPRGARATASRRLARLIDAGKARCAGTLPPSQPNQGAVASLQATMGYYRAMFDPARGDPALSDLRTLLARPITLPTLALCGAKDLRAELMRWQDAYFTGGYRDQEVPGTGHFLHREQSAAVKQLLLDWLRQGLSRFRQRHGKMVFHFAA